MNDLPLKIYYNRLKNKSMLPKIVAEIIKELQNTKLNDEEILTFTLDIETYSNKKYKVYTNIYKKKTQYTITIWED